jgi:hypothetical protein
MKLTALVLALCVMAPAAANGKGKPRRSPARVAPELPRSQPAPLPADTRVEPGPDVKPPPAKPAKPKVYTFTGLDVDGKLKTPQLLFFFDRVKLELDTTAQPKRSFMKELEATSNDKGL